MSPCAYLVGLLHPLVIEELDLARHGYRTFVVDPTQWTPVRRRHVVVPVARCGEDGGVGRRDRSGRRRRVPRLRGAVRPHHASGCVAGRAATSGSARHRTGPRSPSSSPTTTKRGTCVLDASIADVVERSREGRAAADRAPRPGRDRDVRGPARSGHRLDPRTPQPRSAAAAGRSSRAAWAGSPSASPTPRASGVRCSQPACRSRRSSPGVGVRLDGGETIRGACSRQQRRSRPHRCARRGWRSTRLSETASTGGASRAPS